MLSEVFWSFFTTAMVGIIYKLINVGYKSKCKEISCCGIRILRDTETEQKELEFTTLHPVVRTESQDGQTTPTTR
jgi:hypothetical protein